MARDKPRKPEWPQLWFGPNGESNMYGSPAEVPRGFSQIPLKLPEPPAFVPRAPPTRDELRAVLKSYGIKIDPCWSIAKMEQMITEL